MRSEWRNQITFEIVGQSVAQGRPQARKSFTGKTGFYDSTKFREFKQYMKFIASQRKPQELIQGPIHLELTFCQPTPKKYQTRAKQELIAARLLLPITKPDVDNLAKVVKDGLSKIIWQDDSQVVSMMVKKLYSMTPRVVVLIH
ncbi:RusA family crossover junction endodeoxyribonuclease [Planococcus sp. SIMBA_160]